MLKNILLVIFSFYFHSITLSQIKVGDNPNTINSNAILELESTNKGLIIPRVQLNDIATVAPLTGTVLKSTLIYSDGGGEPDGYYYWNGLKWVKLLGNDENTDNDWHKESTTEAPSSINDNIFTMGNVGIGLNNPSEALEIENGHVLLDNNYAIGRSIGSATDEHIIYPYRNGIGSMGILGPSAPYGAALSIESDAEITFVETDANKLVGYMDVNSEEFIWSGKIGINETSPSSQVHVKAFTGKPSQGQILIEGNSENENGDAYISFYEGGEASNIWSAGLDDDNDGFAISNNLAIDNNNLFFIQTTGNVGIGTTSPNSKLTVNGGTINLNVSAEYGGDFPTDNSNYNNVLAIGGIGAETGLKIYKQNSGSSGTFLGAHNYLDCYVFEMTDVNSVNPDGGIVFGETGNDDVFEAIMVIRGNRRIGMGVISPSYKLELPNTASNGEGRARAQSWNTYSDKRIKSNVKTIEYGLNSILALEPSSYFQHNSKADSSGIEIYKEGEKNIGFMAQDLYKTIPEAVNKPADENIDLWSVDYTRLIPVLTKAIQEQQEQLEILKKEIEILKSERK